MRVVELLNYSIPVVELFYPMGKNNPLGSLNTTMKMETGFYLPGLVNGQSSEAFTPRLAVHLEIPPPVIPQADEELKVRVVTVRVTGRRSWKGVNGKQPFQLLRPATLNLSTA